MAFNNVTQIKHNLILFLIAFIFFFIFPDFSSAQEGSRNNIYGIHLNQLEDQDMKDAASLVGDWGYVVTTIRIDQCHKDHLGDAFNKLRRYHLTPLVRLASTAEGPVWKRPDMADVDRWVECLNSLSWPTKRRHVILFNEVNHAQEWGGSVDPEGYAEIAIAISQKLKAKNKDFFILPAGFDAAAGPPNNMDEVVFLQRMIAHKPDIINNFDGWTSHSYPNPGYVTSPLKTDRNSVRTYDWELSLLKQLGIEKNFCVYITETGWAHAEGINYDRRFLPAQTIKQYFKTYFDLIAQDDRVCAVTPFIINDQSDLFDNFSWKKPNSSEFYEFAESLASIEKPLVWPEQKQLIGISAELPGRLVTNSKYSIPITLKNGGQAWWDHADQYHLAATDGIFSTSFSEITDVQPHGAETVDFILSTGTVPGNYCQKIGFFRGTEKIADLFSMCFSVDPTPELRFRVGRLIPMSGDNFEIRIVDSENQVVFLKRGISIVDGYGSIAEIPNIVLGQPYTAVILKKGHIPQREPLIFEVGLQAVQFNGMVPVDFNNDGSFSLQDILEFKKKFLN